MRENRKESPLYEKNREENNETFPEGEPVDTENVKHKNEGYRTGDKPVREALPHEGVHPRVTKECRKDKAQKLSKGNIEDVEDRKKNEYPKEYQDHSEELQLHHPFTCVQRYSTIPTSVLE
ncbi:hypothetical protein ACMTAS_0619 [Thermotoga neapolitana DSM 4359]|uniref:Uncharacterized protein n=1 Tax=Thermotoga neapolitana (strain ATCC 49049 / DSM 4359 / NBRC 107923 / NS-E) TaxID=309803 RepID=B9KB41_THENN|nr:hypothetical protein [Thermotoga neapolitana]ACM22238.1 Putative uncharacterized protein [Thermotoga neapolitana DSM 4359]